LDVLHRHNVLHRDIKPSNLLLGPNDGIFLIDFGSARQWHADLTLTQTVQFSPGYAPPEQFSDRARRGPATDIYALCATAYALLLGSPPPSALDRVAEDSLVSIKTFRPDVPEDLREAVEAGLNLRYEKRPQDVAELRRMVEGTPNYDAETNDLAGLDSKRLRLLRFRFEPRQCPATDGVLEEPQPISRSACPVCQEGDLVVRELSERVCPSCRVGVLHERRNDSPLRYSPKSKVGVMKPKRGWPWFRVTSLICASDGFSLTVDGDEGIDAEGNRKSFEEWRRDSGRAEAAMECDECQAQVDILPDGRWRQVHPKPDPDGWVTLYPDEWARVAAGLEPGSGNATCSACDSDFYLEEEKITLLAPGAESSFAEHFTGRLLGRDDACWLAVGKESGRAGYVSEDQSTEFDREPNGDLKLVRTKHRVLANHLGESHALGDWHRLAQQLPLFGEEGKLTQDLAQTLVGTICTGDTPFDATDSALLWDCKAISLPKQKRGRLTVFEDRICFKTLLSQRSIAVADLRGVQVKENVVEIEAEGEEPCAFEIEPTELNFKLASGRLTVDLGAPELGTRLENLLIDRVRFGGVSVGLRAD
jgi:hypothetical protein